MVPSTVCLEFILEHEGGGGGVGVGGGGVGGGGRGGRGGRGGLGGRGGRGGLLLLHPSQTLFLSCDKVTQVRYSELGIKS